MLHTYRGYTITLDYDQDAPNPGDCMPPLIAAHLDRSRYSVTDARLAVPALTRERVATHLPAILLELGHTSTLLSVLRKEAPSHLSRYASAAEALQEVLEAHFDGLSVPDQLEMLATAYGWQGIPARVFARSGHDYLLALLVATPDWCAETGAAITGADQLASYADTYAAWAFGDVYHYSVEDQAGDTVESCGGYYSRGDAESAAQEAIDYLHPHAVAELQATITTARTEARRLLRESRPYRHGLQLPETPALCAAIKAAVQSHLHTISQARQALAALNQE